MGRGYSNPVVCLFALICVHLCSSVDQRFLNHVTVTTPDQHRLKPWGAGAPGFMIAIVVCMGEPRVRPSIRPGYWGLLGTATY